MIYVKLLYYPGCTIKRNALEYEESAIAVLEKIGYSVRELSKWYCCGAYYSLATDDLIRHVGALRTLIKAESDSKDYGSNDLVVLCPMCYNVLKRVDLLVRENTDKLETLTKFMDEEEPYQASIAIHHVVEILYKSIEAIRKNIVADPSDLRIACYYGCTIVRPKEIGVDNPEYPTIMDEIIKATGAEAIEYPFKTECCGSYQLLHNKSIVVEKTKTLINEAVKRGADLIVTTCPLCSYNLRVGLESMRRKPDIGIAYITEYLAYIMGLTDKVSSVNKLFFEKKLGSKG